VTTRTCHAKVTNSVAILGLSTGLVQIPSACGDETKAEELSGGMHERETIVEKREQNRAPNFHSKHNDDYPIIYN